MELFKKMSLDQPTYNTAGEFSPTSIRLSPELKFRAKKLAYKRYKDTEISRLFKDLLIKALKEEDLL